MYFEETLETLRRDLSYYANPAQRYMARMRNDPLVTQAIGKSLVPYFQKASVIPEDPDEDKFTGSHYPQFSIPLDNRLIVLEDWWCEKSSWSQTSNRVRDSKHWFMHFRAPETWEV